ncbi:DUF4158 domain-containing protein [Nocardia gipuzkoensis]
MDAGGKNDWRLVGNKSGATRLGFALLLKFFEIEARFPRAAAEVPAAVVSYVAEQVKVDPALFASYRWSGWTIEYHRAQVRAAFGFREFAVSDEDRLIGWLAEEMCPVELREDRLREAVLVRCRAEKLEPPTPGQILRPLQAATPAPNCAAGRRFGGRCPKPRPQIRSRPGILGLRLV